ncbi:UNKNOWN [Stylonychia lemnae]|uniref:Uncharacterized protein n=1 Tax=Stylonychia lemnae TaxID=5949 RepID=A0A078AU25_STYLE|nr:UNKNOWN [Stylonychia lemnae]|eukprot:CDW84737.1 UNKNOWN [Stylonychia lemnae]
MFHLLNHPDTKQKVIEKREKKQRKIEMKGREAQQNQDNVSFKICLLMQSEQIMAEEDSLNQMQQISNQAPSQNINMLDQTFGNQMGFGSKQNIRNDPQPALGGNLNQVLLNQSIGQSNILQPNQNPNMSIICDNIDEIKQKMKEIQDYNLEYFKRQRTCRQNLEQKLGESLKKYLEESQNQNLYNDLIGLGRRKWRAYDSFYNNQSNRRMDDSRISQQNQDDQPMEYQYQVPQIDQSSVIVEQRGRGQGIKFNESINREGAEQQQNRGSQRNEDSKADWSNLNFSLDQRENQNESGYKKPNRGDYRGGRGGRGQLRGGNSNNNYERQEETREYRGDNRGRARGNQRGGYRGGDRNGR